jgi:2-oxoglutarate dehydrogenase E1 component
MSDSASHRIHSSSLPYVEEIYGEYLENPDSVPEEWRGFFRSLEPPSTRNGVPKISPTLTPPSLFNPARNGYRNGAPDQAQLEETRLQLRVDQLVRSYRVRGHLHADLDPLGLPRPRIKELDPLFYGIRELDLGRRVPKDTVYGPSEQTVGEALDRLRNTYSRSIGVQYMHIDDLSVKMWLMERMERSQNRLKVSGEQQKRILTKLTDAVIFEEFIQKKYVGAKSFSLEGAESLIPLLDLAIEKASSQGIQEIVMAMAHRGRLNVLANIMGKHPRKIFREFEDDHPELQIGRGDVKYHLGYSNDYQTQSGRKVHLSLCFNPSHLEFVNPVALGRVRAKQDRFGDDNHERCMGLLIHGDASFAGQGIVQEILNMSQIPAYATGGTLHVVVNNQIGFTTPPEQGRSNTYATAVGKMLQIPIFHVNGEDPEAVAQVVNLAMDFRREFKRDVLVDMYCYRLHGHNEGDEPSFTQPVLYRAIKKRQSVRDGYLEHLLKLNEVTREEADQIAKDRRQHLEDELTVARDEDLHHFCVLPHGIWSGYRGGDENGIRPVETGVERELLSKILIKQTELPKDFSPHPKIQKGLRQKQKMAQGKAPLDWAAAESLAFGTLSLSGFRIRMTGEDCERGTFSQRHAVLHDYEDGSTYTPLKNLSPDQAPFDIHNSPLSEAGVLGYEYGYSLEYPDGLVLWEAQFGDFINAAQVIVDQFIASAEDKWFRLSGLVLLLPHGFEGMGPEHSSARLERFLLSAADYNMQVVNPTSPAQYFHVLRRQALASWRKPLIIMTPKSLLRNNQCFSPLEELGEGNFKRIIGDTPESGREINRILLCSGKVYYDLESRRNELGREDVAIIRIEQLYPLENEHLAPVLAPYSDGIPAYWVQEEPENMGAWRYMRVKFGERLLGRFPFEGVTRPASASPATGSMSTHLLEQDRLLSRAFGQS